MMNYYEYVLERPEHFRQFACNNILFLHYTCPVRVNKLDLWSKYNHFVYVLSGKKRWHFADKSWEVLSGDSIFVKKGACVIEQFLEEDYCVLVFFVPDDYVHKLLQDSQIQFLQLPPDPIAEEPLIRIDVTPVIEAFYQSVIAYFTRPNPPVPQLIELKFRELLLNILSDSSNQPLVAFLRTMQERQPIQIRKVMDDNYLYDLELKEYAELCNRSLSSFKRDFQAQFGTTPGKWLTDKRLQHASWLLNSTAKPVNEVALESGFENAAHFCRAFKDKFNLSPLQFRSRTLTGALT